MNKKKQIKTRYLVRQRLTCEKHVGKRFGHSFARNSHTLLFYMNMYVRSTNVTHCTCSASLRSSFPLSILVILVINFQFLRFLFLPLSTSSNCFLLSYLLNDFPFFCHLEFLKFCQLDLAYLSFTIPMLRFVILFVMARSSQ